MVDLSNPNDFIKKLKQQHYNPGYKVDDMPQIRAVYDFLEANNYNRDNFMLQLQNLILIKQKNNDNTAAGYNPKTNTITYYDERDLIHELFHVASTQNDGHASGISKYDGGIKINYGLDEGITDMFAEMTDSSVPCGYPFEKMCAEMLRGLFGPQIFDAYFENSYKHFIDGFPKELHESIDDLITYLDEFQDLTHSIYQDDYFEDDIETLVDITEHVMECLTEIAEAMGHDKSEAITFFNQKSQEPKMEVIKELIRFDDAIQNISNRGLK